MTRLPVLIVDDERICRSGLIRLLAADHEVEIAGECADGLEAVTAIRTLASDFDFIVVGQQANQPVTADPFVVDDEYRKLGHDCR